MGGAPKQSGFTLVELLIVVLIIGILATVAIPVFNGQRAKAKDAEAKSALRNALGAARSFYTAKDSYAGIYSAGTAWTTALRDEEASLSSYPPNPDYWNYYAATPGTGVAGDPTPSVIFTIDFFVGTQTALLCNHSRSKRSFCILDVAAVGDPPEIGAVGTYFGASREAPTAACPNPHSICNAYADILTNKRKQW